MTALTIILKNPSTTINLWLKPLTDKEKEFLAGLSTMDVGDDTVFIVNESDIKKGIGARLAKRFKVEKGTGTMAGAYLIYVPKGLLRKGDSIAL